MAMDILYMMKKEMLRRGLSNKTIITYTQCIKQFMRFCDKDWLRVRKGDITEYIDRLVEKGVSGSTLNVHINALKFVMEELLKRRVTLSIKFSKTPKKLPVFLTKEEVIMLFNAVSNPIHRLILEMIYSAGLRVSEVVKLKRYDLEFERSIGWVRGGKGNKDRPFIIAKCLHERLKEHISKNNSVYLFSGRKGTHLHVRSVQEIVKQSAKNAGITKNVHPHSLRHSFATHLIEYGYDIASIQPLLGHNSAKTTLAYIHMVNPKMISVKSPYDLIHEKKHK